MNFATTIPVALGTVGVTLLVFARAINVAMIRLAEWQLAMMRRSWGIWCYRAFGVVFLAGAIAAFLSPAQH